MSKYYKKLSELKGEETLKVLYDCIEILGAMSLKQYAEMHQVTKPVVIDRIKKGKLPVLNFDGRQYPLINLEQF